MSDADNKEFVPGLEPPTQTDVSGRAEEAERLARYAKTEAGEAGRAFAAKFPILSLKQRQQLASAFRGGLIPRRKPGKRPKKEITAAYADWCNGMRGPAFFEKHIRNYPRLSEWRQRYEARRLVEAMRSRKRRSRRTGTDGQL